MLILALIGAGGSVMVLRPAADQSLHFVVGMPSGSQLEVGDPWLYPRGSVLFRAQGSDLSALEGFEVTSRPSSSFDGSSLLFSGRRKGEPVSQIWEIGATGSTPKRLTDLSADGATPHYLPDGRIVFAELRVPSENESVLRTTLFVRDESGAISRISFGDSLDLIERILEDGRLLVRRIDVEAKTNIELALRPDGTELGLYLMPSSDSDSPSERAAAPDQAPGEVQLRDKLGRIEGYSVKEVISMLPRAVPPVATSLVDSAFDHGWLLCLDVRQTGLATDLGRVEVVRVVDAHTGETVGGGPVEADGSFFLKVPADRLLRLELEDERGDTLARLASGIWVRPNEHRGCIGCHEPRHLSPRNRVPLALEAGPIADGRALTEARLPERGEP